MATDILDRSAAPTAKGAAPALESRRSAVSFSAIFAGALAMAASSLVLAFVGAGMGLAIATPWSGAAAAATKFATSTAIALIIIEWLSAAIGGYVAGRMRVKWASVHDEQVFFEDTAHGFLAWSVATLFAAWLFAGAFASALSGGAHALTGAATNSGHGATTATAEIASPLTGQVDYWTDELLRAPQGAAAGSSAGDARGEIERILRRGLTGDIPQADRDYAAQLVAAKAGVDASDAKKRVDAVVQQIGEAKHSATALADSTREVAAATSMMTALALAIGAFIASAAAALGGWRRDE